MSKTNTGLVEYAKAQLGKPYWYGCFGQISTAALYNSKKSQYPNEYQWSCPSNQLNVRVHDCIGLIKGYLWSENATSTPKYNSAQDVSANGMLEKCKEKGTISTIPELPGVLVFMSHHVGVYIGNGEVVEAKGHAWGVVKTKLKGRGWTNWGKCPWIEYSIQSKKTTTNTATTSKITTQTKSTIIAKGKVTASALNVRKGAGVKYDVITTIKNGKEVSITGKDGSWYKVIVDSITGYVKAEYVSWTGTVTGSTVNIRKGAGTNYGIYTTVPKGTKVTVIDSTGTWYKVRVTYNGKSYTGYMSATYIA